MAITLKYPPTALLSAGFFAVLLSAVFNYTLSIMAAAYIVSDLGGSTTTATYATSFFALGNALGIPLGSSLSCRLGTARSLVITLLLFALCSGVCAIASTYPSFLVARFFQGFVAGPFYLLVFHLSSSLRPQEKKRLFGSITDLVFTLGPILGACWGGWIAYEWDWRIPFYFNIPLLIGLALFLKRRLQGFDADKVAPPPFDGIGYATYCIALVCVGSALITGQELDWFRSPLVSSMMSIGLLCGLFFLFWEGAHPTPLIELQLFKNPVLVFALFNLGLLFFIYFGTIVLLALWLNLWANYTPTWIAALFGVMVLTAIFPATLVHKKVVSQDDRLFLIAAILCLIISSLHTTFFSVIIDLKHIVISRIFAGLGFSFFLGPLFRLCAHSIGQAKILFTPILFHIVRALASGLGAAVFDTIWQRRQVFFYDRLGSKLTQAAAPTQAFFSKAKQVGLQGLPADAQLDYYLQRQATALALDDCFYLMAWILVGLLASFLITFFFKRGSFITE
jgi:DHA2 family multidrug resistance protein